MGVVVGGWMTGAVVVSKSPELGGGVDVTVWAGGFFAAKKFVGVNVEPDVKFVHAPTGVECAFARMAWMRGWRGATSIGVGRVGVGTREGHVDGIRDGGNRESSNVS